ncbi:MAG: DMT family transporter [Hyphomicrobiaceae bacterium]
MAPEIIRTHPAASIDQPRAVNNTAGMLAMMVAMIALIGSDSLVKLTSDRLPLGEILAVRSAMMVALMLPVAAWLGYLRPLKILTEKIFSIRILGELIAVSFYFTALFRMPLADVNALIQFAPLATIMAASLLFGDPVGWRRWLAAIVGLAGVILIIQPGSGNFTPYALCVFVAVAGVAMRDIATREMDRTIPSFFIAMITGAAVGLLGLALAPFETWVTPTQTDMLRLAGAGAFLVVAYLLMIVAVRTGELSVVAPFRFTKVIWGVLVGYLIWGYIPNALALTGFALVIGAGLYAFFRERQLERRNAASPQPDGNPV